MSIEELPLRQVAMDVIFPFTYTGNLGIEATTSRLYNDTDQDRVIKLVRASVGSAATGAGVIVDVLKNGTTIFTPDDNPSNPYPGDYSRVYIPPSVNTATSEPRPDAIWKKGEYLTVSIDQIGSTFAGADLTINVVVSE